MPAAKSRKELPSTSSTIAPCPRLATSGQSRVYDGDMNFASCSRTRLAFGPGNTVTSRGVLTSNVVGISSSIEETKVGVIRKLRGESRRANRRIRDGPAREKINI